MAHAKASTSFQNICFKNFSVIMHYEFHFHESCIHSVIAVGEACQYETLAAFFLSFTVSSLDRNIVLIPLESFLQFSCGIRLNRCTTKIVI
jgi:hypothetical protein